MAAPMECPSGYRLVPVKFEETCLHSHAILYKENKTRNEDPDKPSKRTLLLLNVPPYCQEVSIRKIFTKFGDIESVRFEKKLGGDLSGEIVKRTLTDHGPDDVKLFPSERLEGYRYGFVVFRDSESVAAALCQPDRKKPVLLSTKEKPVLVGMAKWLKAYRQQYPDKKSLQENVDGYMTKYDAAVQRAEEEEVQRGEEVDEDGWIKVTRKGKNPVIARTESNQIKARVREKARRKKKELLNAYSYQIRESKRQKIAELRVKFEEDKERVETMREARKFRPF